MNGFVNKSVSCLSLFALCSCASIVSKSQRPVTINSSPAGAKVTVYNHSGAIVQKGETPLTMNLETSAGYFRRAKYTVEVAGKGPLNSVSSFSSRMNGWYWGNLLFGGWIGMLIVDPATGAMWKLDESYTVSLPPATAVSNKEGRGLRIAHIDEVPLHLRTHLVSMN
jgi:hypothetical protein